MTHKAVTKRLKPNWWRMILSWARYVDGNGHGMIAIPNMLKHRDIAENA
jgi:hypothetical protein